MSVEKFWLAVAPQAFTANGTAQGIVTIADTAGFKVKQTVSINGTDLPPQLAEVKRVLSPTQLIVGPIPVSLQPPQRQQGVGLLSKRLDISAYTTAAGSYIFAGEQPKAQLKPDDIIQAVYSQEPTVAIRTASVDQYGSFYTPTNPVPVGIWSAAQFEFSFGMLGLPSYITQMLNNVFYDTVQSVTSPGVETLSFYDQGSLVATLVFDQSVGGWTLSITLPTEGFLELETGGYLLQENGGHIIV